MALMPSFISHLIHTSDSAVSSRGFAGEVISQTAGARPQTATIPYELLAAATNNFAEKLGSGGEGEVCPSSLPLPNPPPGGTALLEP